MEKSRYKSIDISELKFGKPIPANEALKDVTPVNWGEDVLNGKKKVTVRIDKERRQ